ncbi:MAG TPA: hypothetical protein VIP11_12310 [Gemmatimonadaceae bacterium]
MGGHREVVLATYVAARLVHDALPERGVSSNVRTERISAARVWLSSLTLPPTVRPAIVKVVEASAGAPLLAAEAVRAVLSVTATLLDARARQELEHLATALERS